MGNMMKHAKRTSYHAFAAFAGLLAGASASLLAAWPPNLRARLKADTTVLQLMALATPGPPTPSCSPTELDLKSHSLRRF